MSIAFIVVLCVVRIASSVLAFSVMPRTTRTINSFLEDVIEPVRNHEKTPERITFGISEANIKSLVSRCDTWPSNKSLIENIVIEWNDDGELEQKIMADQTASRLLLLSENPLEPLDHVKHGYLITDAMGQFYYRIFPHYDFCDRSVVFRFDDVVGNEVDHIHSWSNTAVSF